MEKWDKFKNKTNSRQEMTIYVQVEEIYNPWDWGYIDKIKELWAKTKWRIIKYKKCTSSDFEFWYINYMTFRDFRKNFSIKI